MFTTNRSNPFIFVFCATALAVLIATGAGIAALLLRQTNTVANGDPIRAAMQRAREAGAYHFNGDVSQVTLPTARITNVGRASRSQQLYVEGQTDVRQNTLEMKLWGQDGSVVGGQNELGVKVENGKSYMRQGAASAWQENSSISTDGIAPNGDFMSFLRAVRNVQAHEPETRAGLTFVRYSFEIDGPAFAAFVRDQMQAALQAKGELVPGTHLDVPARYSQMTGDGELWVHVGGADDGLPLRQILNLNFPDLRDSSQHAQIKINFTQFAELPASAPMRVWRAVQDYLPSPFTAAIVLMALAATGFLFCFYASRRFQRVLTVSLITVIVSGPALNGIRTGQIVGVQIARAASEKEQQKEVDAAMALRAMDASAAFSPHQNPVQAGELRAREEARMASAINTIAAYSVAAAPAQQALPTDNGADADSDGLSDFAEQRVGTDSKFNDSDEDGLLDGVEVKGFAMGGKTWYLNPLDIDSNKDGLSDALEYDNDGNTAADDTDADGLPDVFDADNDNDGVPDDKDTAPFSRLTNVFGENSPMNLILNGLAAGKATFVDFQVRPQTASHLWYAFNVLDWPQDTDGQMRDVDGKTFADLGGAGANEANGDMRLIPMLEIRVPNNGANVPTQADLTPYNITVNSLNASGSIKVVYVPLSVVTDEKTGERVAFNARMRYAPTGSWPLPHEVRLVWNVLALSDVPCDSQASNAAAQGCQSDGYIHNAGQVLHSYADSFTLTGLNVTEDNGAGVAIVYEDPAVDANKKDDATLMGLSHGLDNSFLGARDEDNNGVRDVTLSEIQRRFDRTQNASVSSVVRWGLSNVLRVELTEYDLADKANVFTAMTETKRILNSVFAPSWQADKTVKPLLLFAQEQRFRGLNLDGLRGGGNFVTLAGSDVIFNMAPAGQTATPIITSASAKWMPYCAPNAASPTWAACEADAYWAELEARHGAAITIPGDPADTDVAAGRVLAMQMYVLALMQGVNRVVQSGSAPVRSNRYTLKSDSELDTQIRTLGNVGAAAVGAIASEVITAKFIDKVTMLQHFGRQLKEIRAGVVGQLGKDAISILKAFRSGGHLNRFVGTAIVGGATAVLAGIVVGAYFLANAVLSDDPTTNKAAKITIRTLTVAITVYLSAISPLMQLNEWRKAVSAAGSTLRLGSSIKAAAMKGGAVATLIAAAVTWGFFIYAMVQNNVSAFSPEFNKAFAEAIATTIYLLVTLLISSTVIGTILVAIIAAIDAILTAICELGVDELRTVPGLGGACFTLGTSAIKVLAYLIYNYEPMVDTNRSDMVVTGQMDVDLADPSKGYVAGNSVTVGMPITTNIRHKNPDPAEGLLINLYLYLFSPSNLRSSTYAYSLSKGDAPQSLTVARDQMTNAWSVSEREDKYVATTMYKAYAATNAPAPVSGITLTAGINKAVEFNMNMGYAIPAYECWLMPLPFIPFVPPIPVCYTRELAGTTSTKFDNLKYDIYPPTLDGFMTLSNKGANGLGLGWDAGFDALADADGDGLISTARNGIDPNDGTWDADGDGLSDTFELERRQAGVAYSPISCDTDLDGLADKQEMEIGSDPAKADSDNDGLKDGDEVWHLVYTIATSNNVTTCAPTANSAGGWDVTINAAVPFVVRVSSNPLLADGDSDGVSDLAEKQLAQSATASQRVDAENRPYHPNILNTPPVQVYTQISDLDGIIGPNQSIVHTTTIVASAPLSYAVLDVSASAALGAVPGARSIPLVATTPQTATVLTGFTAQSGAATQNVAITSSVRSRLGNTGTPGYIFEPIVSEAALGSFVAPNAARSVGLSPARVDRQDNYFLSALTSDSGANGGNGDVVNYAIPSGANSALENDGSNIFAKRGNTAPAIATNNFGDSLIVWEQKDRCNVITFTAMSIGVAAVDGNTSGIEPRISLKSETTTPGLYTVNGFPVIWDWTTGGGTIDMVAGNFRGQPNFGFPIVRTVCGAYTIQLWESDGGGVDENAGAQTIDSMAGLGNFTLAFAGSGHSMYLDVSVQPKDEYVLQGALVGADGAVKKRLSFARPPVANPLYKTKSFGPSVASDGSGFLVAYEAIAVTKGPTQQWVGETDGLTYLAAQAFDANGNATGNSAGFAYFQNGTSQRSMAHSTAWLGNTYRTVLKALNRTEIDFVDFSTIAALGTTQFGPGDGTTGTDAKLNAPQIAYDPTSGRWLMAYVKSGGQAQFNVYPNVGSITPSAQQTGSPGAVGVSAAFNPISQGWLVAGLFNNGLYSVNPVKLSDLTAQTPTFQGWTISDNTQPPAMACPLPASQPVLDLGFEELPGATTYADASGFGNNAACGSSTQCPTNGASGAVDANGVAAGTPASDFALQLNGNQYLRVPNSARLQWAANDSLTWLTWVKVSSGTPILRKGLGNANDLVMTIASDTGQLRMAFGSTANTVTAGPDLRDNKWHQVAATLNRSTGVAALFVDGVSRGTGGFSGSFVTNDDLFIGSNNANGFVGLMDGVQLYRSALGADAVKALYDRTQQHYCVAARPAANGSAINWAKLRVTQPDVRGGKVTASNSLTLTIDGDAPRSALTSVQNNQFVDNSPTSRDVDRILVIGGSASDSTSGISKVEVSVNGGAWQTASGDESWTYPLVLNLRGFGSENEMLYRIRTRATDSVGNVETPSVEIVIRGDLEDPVLDFADPAPRITRNAAGRWVARITGSGHDNLPSSGVKSIWVQLFSYANANNPNPDVAVGGQQRATVTANSVANGFNNFDWAIDYVLPSNVTDAPPSGSFLAVVRIEDTVDQKVTDGIATFPQQQQRVVRLDGAGPNAAMTTSDAARGIYTNTITSTSTVTIAGIISDTSSGLDKVEVAFVPISQVLPYSDTALLLRLDEGAGSVYFQDASGQFNNAYCPNTTQCITSSIAGRISTGASFNGNQYVRVKNAPSLNFDGSASFTWMAWVKTNTGSPIMRKGLGGTNDLMMAITNDTGQLRMAFGDPNGSTTLTGGPNLRDNQWHHVAATLRRSDGQATLYVDGVAQGSGTFSGGFVTPDDLFVGSGNFAGFNGSLDEVTIFRHALSAADVRALYRTADRVWLPATLARRGADVVNTTWSLAVPAGLEGIYQIDLRGYDFAGNRQLNSGAWRGIVDGVAPRVSFTGAATGQSYLDANTNTRQYEMRYTCKAEDWQINEASFDCPGNSQQTPTRGFNTDPTLLAQFPSLSVLNAMTNTYTIWQANTQPVGSARACDATGKCVTATAAPAANFAAQTNKIAFGANTANTFDPPNAVIVDPTDGNVIALLQGNQNLQVTVAGEASNGLKTIDLYLDDVLQSTMDFAQADAAKSAIRTVTITPTVAGAHVLTAKATDWAGHTQVEITPVTVTVVTGLPEVEMDRDYTVLTDAYGLRSNIVVLRGRASTQALAAVKVRVNGGRWAEARFGEGRWEIALPVRDLQGQGLNVTLEALDLFGQVKQHSLGETVMLTDGGNPPDTTLIEGPSGTTESLTATVSFSGTQGAREIVGFECAMNDGGYAPCVSPFTFGVVSNGEHTLRVRAVDADGYVDPTPASVTWTVHMTAMETTVTSAPSATGYSRDAQFGFEAEGADANAGEFECALDGGEFAPCSSPQTYSGLEDGAHSFLVRAKNGAGVVGAATRYAWTIANNAPIAHDQEVTVANNQSVDITLNATDSDVLRYKVVSKPSNGVLHGIAPNVTYVPNTGFVGEDSFTFKATDAESDSEPATARIKVTSPQTEGPSTLTIVLDAQPDARQNFRFISNLGNFRLDDVAVDDGDAFTNSITFEVMPQRTYTFKEQVPGGWMLADIVCDTPHQVNVPEAEAEIVVNNNEQVTCTFVNTRQTRAVTGAPVDEDEAGYDGAAASSGTTLYLPLVAK